MRREQKVRVSIKRQSTDRSPEKVFGKHPHLLRSFLNAMLPLPEGTSIDSLEYLRNDMVPEIPLMKYSIVDVRCKSVPKNPSPATFLKRVWRRVWRKAS